MEASSSVQRILVADAQCVERQWPSNIRKEDMPFFLLNRKLNIPATYALHLHGVSVLSDGVVFRGLHIYDETFVGPSYRVHNWRGLLYIYLKLPVKDLSSEVRYLLVHDGWARNYYHWIADTLPRLFTVKERIADYTILLPADFDLPFIKETLHAFGVEKIEWLEKNTRYLIPDLLVPLRYAPVANYRPNIMKELAFFLRGRFPIMSNINHGDKIYISRSRAPRRKIINEYEVSELLKKKGFIIVNFEDYSFREQVSIAAQARYLVSIHGAGLTNMLFMPPNGRVLELQMRDDGTNCYYYTMADALGLGYYYQFCTPNDSSLSVQDADLMVDLTELAANINVLLQE